MHLAYGSVICSPHNDIWMSAGRRYVGSKHGVVAINRQLASKKLLCTVMYHWSDWALTSVQLHWTCIVLFHLMTIGWVRALACCQLERHSPNKLCSNLVKLALAMTEWENCCLWWPLHCYHQRIMTENDRWASKMYFTRVHMMPSHTLYIEM